MQNANLHKERLTLNEVAKRLKVHVATVYRWTVRGVRGRRLPSFLIGGRRFITRSDLEWFLQPRDRPASEGDPQRSKQANDRLRSFGINGPKGQDGVS